ncbi:MAG: hypothetical protein ROO76_01950 [Terriglobia bacterium]|nr:hypothetical protein [Terriglobia bacterium]
MRTSEGCEPNYISAENLRNKNKEGGLENAFERLSLHFLHTIYF